MWELPGATERLEIVGAELLEEGTFDEAVHGVHTVFHTACPVVYDPNGDPEVLDVFLLFLLALCVFFHLLRFARNPKCIVRASTLLGEMDETSCNR